MRAHDLQAYRKMNVTRERIRRILKLREMLLSVQTGFNLSVLWNFGKVVCGDFQIFVVSKGNSLRRCFYPLFYRVPRNAEKIHLIKIEYLVQKHKSSGNLHISVNK